MGCHPRSCNHDVMTRPKIHATAITLRLDRETVRLAKVFAEAELDYVLLKGPALKAWLYPDAARAYGDIDLLIPPQALERAAALLATLGYVAHMPKANSVELTAHSRNFVHRDGVVLDLHTRLSGANATEDAVWEALSQGADIILLEDHAVKICGLHARIVIVVLHAAQHGQHESKPMEDLHRMGRCVSTKDLVVAAQMADDIGATESFAAGLCLDPHLRELAPHLARLPVSLSVRARMAGMHHKPGGAKIVAARSGDWPSRLRLLAGVLWPTVDFLRTFVGPDRATGPLWVSRARLRRLIYSLRHLPQAVKDVRRVPD